MCCKCLREFFKNLSCCQTSKAESSGKAMKTKSNSKISSKYEKSQSSKTSKKVNIEINDNKDRNKSIIKTDNKVNENMTKQKPNEVIIESHPKDFQTIKLPVNSFKNPYEYLEDKNYVLDTDKPIGFGKFGTVYKAYKINPDKSQQLMACKKIQMDLGVNRRLDSLKNELTTLQNLKYEFIIEYYDHFIFEFTGLDLQDSSGIVKKMIQTFIFMEYAGEGTLEDEVKRLHRDNEMTEAIAKRYFGQIVKGIAEMHKRRIAHRDLKLENVFLVKSNKAENLKNVKIGDFGMSQTAYTETEGYIKSKHIKGTSHYMCPEIFKLKVNRKSNTSSTQTILYDQYLADIWALGVCLYRLLTKSYPFDTNDFDNEQVIRNQERKIWKPIKNIDEDCDDLLNRMLEPDVTKRIRIYHIVAHQWLKGETSLTAFDFEN